MEQQYQLKRGQGYSILEQEQMTAEERAWVARRIDRENRERQESEQNQPRPPIPRMPRIRR